MRTLLTLFLVAGALLACGFYIRNHKQQAQAAVAEAAEHTARLAEAARQKVDQAAPAAPQRAEPSVSHLQRLLRGEVPAEGQTGPTRKALVVPNKPQLSRLLATDSSDPNR